MATYRQIQDWVRERYGFVPKTCWIAQVKEIAGILVRRAPKRLGEEQIFPCPQEKVEPIQAALEYFGMIH